MTDSAYRDASLSAALFDALPVSALLHDATTILGSNAAARAVLHVDAPEDIEGLPISDVVHPDGHEAGRQRRELLLMHGQRFSNLAVKLITRTGESVNVRVSSVTFTLGDAPVAIVATCASPLCPDLASGFILPPIAHPAETPLLAAALDAFPLPIIAASDSVIVYANRTAMSVLRARAKEDVIGLPLADIIHPDAAEAVKMQLLILNSDVTRLGPIPVKVRARDGSTVLATVHGCSLEHDDRHYTLHVAIDAAIQ